MVNNQLRFIHFATLSANMWQGVQHRASNVKGLVMRRVLDVATVLYPVVFYSGLCDLSLLAQELPKLLVSNDFFLFLATVRAMTEIGK